jgi:pimeloyl-ACP methyl ester carboxylesterase
MEFNLNQRIIVQFYKTKIKALQKLSPQAAGRAAFRLFCTPGKVKNTQAPPFFHHAEKLVFEFKKISVKGYCWRAKNELAQKVLICHGFQSRAYKFEKYAQLLHQAGFEVLAFDAPAHGDSSGKQFNAYDYSLLIHDIENNYGPIYAVIAHSFGGLAASLAFENINHTLKKLILIAPATETKTAIDQFFHIFHMSGDLREYVDDLVVQLSDKPVNWFSVNRALLQVQCPVLWIHDEHDAQCPYQDTQPTRNLNSKNIQFITTQHLGHNKIYHDEVVQSKVVKFILGGKQ